MTDEHFKQLVELINMHATINCQMLADIRADIEVLTCLVIESSVASGADRAQLNEKLVKLRKRAFQISAEFPPPDPPAPGE